MTQDTFTTVILTPSEGMYLTQVADVELKNRIVASKLALGKNDSADNYKEITKAEGDEIRKQQTELAKAEHEAMMEAHRNPQPEVVEDIEIVEQ